MAILGSRLPLAFFLLTVCAHAQPTSEVTASSLEKLLDGDRLLEFQSQLASANNLTNEEHLYFIGILAFHVGRFADSVKPLVAAVNTKGSSLTGQQIGRALQTLAESAMKQAQYGSAAKMYDDLYKAFGARMADSGKGIKEKRHLAALLQHVPAETVSMGGDFTLRRTGLEYPVSIGGKTFSAQLDTGAELSLLSATTARDWGVTMLDGTATLYGYGGGAFAVQPGFIPELTIGKAELHNVAVYVTADENLYIAEIQRQTKALLGYPVVSALGRLTFTKDGSVSVAAQSPEANPTTNVHLMYGDHALLLPLGTKPVMAGGKIISFQEPRLFFLDTGSESSFLTDHFLAEHSELFEGAPTETARLAGADGIHAIPAYGAHQLPIGIGNTAVMLNGQHILTKPQGGEAERYYGVIGQDVLRSFASYTLDFRTGAFSVQRYKP